MKRLTRILAVMMMMAALLFAGTSEEALQIAGSEDYGGPIGGIVIMQMR